MFTCEHKLGSRFGMPRSPQFNVDAFIMRLAGVVNKGTQMLGARHVSPQQYYRFLQEQMKIAKATLATPLEWQEADHDMGETPAEYAKLEGLDPLDAPEEYDFPT